MSYYTKSTPLFRVLSCYDMFCYASTIIYLLASLDLFDNVEDVQLREIQVPQDIENETFLENLLHVILYIQNKRHYIKYNEDELCRKLLHRIVKEVWDRQLLDYSEYNDEHIRSERVEQMLSEPQDVHEFMDYLLVRLTEDLSHSNLSIAQQILLNIKQIFNGEKLHVSQCQECGKLSEHSEFEQWFTFSICLYNANRSSTELLSYLSDILKRQMLSNCEDCGKNCQHIKWLKAEPNVMPGVLTVNMVGKQEGTVCDVPLTINGTSIYDNNKTDIYKLHALVIFTTKQYGGHFYIIFHDNLLEDTWWKYNDGLISNVSNITEVLKEMSDRWVIIFYKKLSVKTFISEET